MMTQLFCLIAIAITLSYLFPFIQRIYRYRGKHGDYIKEADVALKYLHGANQRQQFNYIRQEVNCFAFEELILTAIENLGHKIQRNKKYTADDGIDGICWIDGTKYLIQAKKYSGHIHLQHLQDFEDLCVALNTKGLFIHSGRTGKQCWKLCHQSTKIQIISGSNMLQLVSCKPFQIR